MFSQELIFNPKMMGVWLVLSLYVLAPILIIALYQKKTWMRRYGTVIAAYTVGLLMALCGLTHFTPDSMEELTFLEWQKVVMNISIPLAIPLMLFKCDFRLWTKALPHTIGALVAGVVAVILAVASGFYLLRASGIPSLEKLSAMLLGMYTGGTMNFNALGAAFSVNQSLMAIVLAFDMLFTVILLFFIMGGGFRLIRRILPYSDETTPAIRRQQKTITPPFQEVENYADMFSRENFWGVMTGLGLSILFLAIGVGVSYLLWWAGWIPCNPDNPGQPVMNELVIILVITTLAIAASFLEKVRELPKTFELGMFFILVFSVSLSSLFDWHSLAGTTMHIGMLVAWVLTASMILHLLFCRILHISGDLYTVSMVSLLCSPPFVPPVVGAMGNKKVLISGIVIGLIGYAVGTYLGVGMAWLSNVL